MPTWLTVASFFSVVVLAAAVIVVKTDKGVLEIETADDGVEVQVKQDGKLVKLVDRKSGWKLDIPSGDYKLTLGNGNEKLFLEGDGGARIQRGLTTLARIRRKPLPPSEAGRVDDTFLRAVAALPAAQQLAAVQTKLEHLNPGFDRKQTTYKVADGKITELGIVTDHVTDLSPLRALPSLRVLNCAGREDGSGALQDLAPLKGLALRELHCYWTRVGNLETLRGMPLEILSCGGRNPVRDLAPLRGMPLRVLFLDRTQVSDLSPLAGMKLTSLNCDETLVRDLSPLKGMPLTSLFCSATPVDDLTSLKGMPLTYLNCRFTQVRDLSPLVELPLTNLVCDFDQERTAKVLRSIKSLQTINTKPAPEFWKYVDRRREARPVDEAFLRSVAALKPMEQVEAVKARLMELNPDFDGRFSNVRIDGGEVIALEFPTDHVTDISPVRALRGLQELVCAGSGAVTGELADLSPLKGMTLAKLAIFWTKVSDLEPLRGMSSLKQLYCGVTLVSDLSPLQGVKLETLWIDRTRVSDLSPLRGLPLAELNCEYTPVKDLAPLRDSPLERLMCTHTRIEDFSILKTVPLRRIAFDFQADRDAQMLRSLPKLEEINGKPTAEFWKSVGLPAASGK